MFFYPLKATSVFLPPLFVFRPKFEFYLKFTQRGLVHQNYLFSFLPRLLVGHQPYPTAIAQHYSTFYIIEIVKYNDIEFYTIIISVLRQFRRCCHRRRCSFVPPELFLDISVLYNDLLLISLLVDVLDRLVLPVLLYPDPLPLSNVLPPLGPGPGLGMELFLAL